MWPISKNPISTMSNDGYVNNGTACGLAYGVNFDSTTCVSPKAI